MLPSFLQPIESVLAGQQTNPSQQSQPAQQAQPTATLNVSDVPAAGGGAHPTHSQGQAQATPSPMTSFTSLTSFLANEAQKAGLAPTASETASKNKLKFMMVSTHIQQYTGYSKVSNGFIKELVKQPFLDLVHFGFQRHTSAPPNYRPYPPSVKVYDAALMERNAAQQLPPQQQQQIQGFGFMNLVEVIRREKPNVVMIYNDMAVVSRFLEEIRKSAIPRTFKLWVYVDQVYNVQLQGYIDILNRDADRVFTFTPYWKKCIKDQGVNRPLDILGHGFESDVFRPVPRGEIRKKLGIPDNAFMLLSLNRNQPRKRLDLLIMAFTELVVKYPTKPIILMCVCDKGDKGGWWLFEIYQRELKLRGVPIEQFGNRLLITSQDMTFSDEDINMFYNAADIGISTVEGEGFGLCAFEQMGVGVPQVLPDIGGHKSFCNKDNSMLVKPKYRYYLPNVYCPVGGEAEVCDPHDICLAVEEYLLNSSKRDAHGKAARETVTGLTWAKATESLVKRLKEVKEEMDEE
jgi:glycosyltransferase involved in cell wall biosynthesis